VYDHNEFGRIMNKLKLRTRILPKRKTFVFALIVLFATTLFIGCSGADNDCPACGDDPIKSQAVGNGKTLLRCENGHTWYK